MAKTAAQITRTITAVQRPALIRAHRDATHRLPWMKGVSIHSLTRKGLIREVKNPKGGFNWDELTELGAEVARLLWAAENPEEAAELEQFAAESAAWAAERAESTRQDQYATARFLFRETCYAASDAVNSYEQNADDTVAEGGPTFTPAQIWDQIGDALDSYGPDAMTHSTEERTPVAALRATWGYLDSLAHGGSLDSNRETEHIADARAVLADEAAEDRALATLAAQEEAEATPDPEPTDADAEGRSILRWCILFADWMQAHDRTMPAWDDTAALREHLDAWGQTLTAHERHCAAEFSLHYPALRSLLRRP